jgi:hypothetical protein
VRDAFHDGDESSRLQLLRDKATAGNIIHIATRARAPNGRYRQQMPAVNDRGAGRLIGRRGPVGKVTKGNAHCEVRVNVR